MASRQAAGKDWENCSQSKAGPRRGGNANSLEALLFHLYLRLPKEPAVSPRADESIADNDMNCLVSAASVSLI